MGLSILYVHAAHLGWFAALFLGIKAAVLALVAQAVLRIGRRALNSPFKYLLAGFSFVALFFFDLPFPLVMVTQFVGSPGAYRAPAPFSPMVAGLLGARITTWTTFAPSSLGIFTFAPWIERLEHARNLQGGLAALTAAVVGVIANLAIWFALHVIDPLQTPDWRSFDLLAFVLSLLAFLLLFRIRIGVFGTLCICGAWAVVARTLIFSA